jgi:hypothetical protein
MPVDPNLQLPAPQLRGQIPESRILGSAAAPDNFFHPAARDLQRILPRTVQPDLCFAAGQLGVAVPFQIVREGRTLPRSEIFLFLFAVFIFAYVIVLYLYYDLPDSSNQVSLLNGWKESSFLLVFGMHSSQIGHCVLSLI